MKTIITIFLVVLTAVSFPAKAEAQDIHPEDILRAGAGDAQILMGEYFKPFSIGFGNGLNAGWFTSPKPHQKYGFDFRISATAALVPNHDMIFDVEELNLNELELVDGPRRTPTLFGQDITPASLGSYYTNPETGQTEELFSFEMPPGLDFRYVITPMAQLTLGLIYDTDVTFRFFPSSTFENDFNVNMWGFGIQHGINQWYNPTNDKLDLSIQIGYTKINSTVYFDVEPEFEPNTEDNNPPSTWENQNSNFNSDGLTVNLLAGRQFKYFTAYGGLGFQKSGISIDVNGTYPTVEPVDPSEYTPGGPTKKITPVTDPFEMELRNNIRPQLLLGGRMRFATITLSATYTLAQYQSLNVGFGLSFR
ncbi:MAG: DUF6588 family protein [Balneolaceae bacterium]